MTVKVLTSPVAETLQNSIKFILDGGYTIDKIEFSTCSSEDVIIYSALVIYS